jgi:hypothetical protein
MSATPGPWFNDDGIIYSEAVRAEEAWIADLRDAMSPDERRANARLITAAPDLLAALQDCAEFLESIDRGEKIAKAARAAIAKATGGAP